jgi:two-component system chemotaxis response regulator CheY
MVFNGKVLLVDDEPHIRKYLGLILRKFGNPTLFEAGNGQEALALYAQHRPDLVLMDVNMPVMDGLQALEQLFRDHPEATVIMLTSLATRSVVEKCVDLGAVNFVRKDTPKETIAKVLSETIEEIFPGE